MSKGKHPAPDGSLESYLLGLSYLESVTKQEFDEAQFLSHQVSDAELNKGLLITSLMLLASLSLQVGISREEVLRSMRDTIISSHSNT